MQDDPAFLPDFFLPDHNIDLSALDISTADSSGRSSILSPHSQQSSHSTNSDRLDSMPGLIIPSSDSENLAGIGGYVLPEENRSSFHRSMGAGGLLEEMDEGFNVDPGFTIDKDGNLVLTEHEGFPQVEDTIETGNTRVGGDLMIGSLAQEAANDPYQGAPLEVRKKWIERIEILLIQVGARPSYCRSGRGPPPGR